MSTKNLINHHPDERVRTAAIRLIDALSSWERTTGRHNIVIIKDSTGSQTRTLDGSPVPEDVTDAQLIESFDNLAADER